MVAWWIFVLSALYMILPGMFANMMPVLVRKVPFLAVPIDGGRKYNGQPLFGKNKTYRGFFFGVLASIVVVYIQKMLYLNGILVSVSVVDYSKVSVVVFGFLMGFGVLFGDLVKSFFKRRLGIKPGARFFPWDQLDSVIGGLVFMSPVFIPERSMIVLLLVMLPVVHISVNHLSFYMGLKETKW